MKSTSAQSALWFAQQLDPQNPTFVTVEYVELPRDVDTAALADAVVRGVTEAGTLTPRITPGHGDIEITYDGGPFPAPEVVVTTTDESDAGLERLRTTPIDPLRDRLFGARIELTPDACRLVLWSHHLVCDLYGYTLLVRRIAEIHSALVSGAEIRAARFGDAAAVHAADERYRDSDDERADAEFWADALRGAPAAPTLAASPPVAASALARQIVTGSARVPGAPLAEAGRSWIDVVTGALAAFVSRRTSGGEVVLGFPTMNRFGTPAAAVVTTAVNVAALRLDVTAADGPDSLAAVVRDALAGIRRHARYRTEWIHRDAQLAAGDAGVVGPVVNVKPFADSVTFAGVSCPIRSIARGPVRDVSFVVERSGDELEVLVDADAARYSADDVRRIAEGAARLVGEVLAGGSPRTADVLAPDEIARVVGPAHSDGSAPDVSAEFDRQCAATPEAPALVAGDVRWTYRELAQRVSTLAAWLRREGAGTEVPVALALSRGADMVVGLLAALRAGAPYVPLDPGFPAHRLEHMLADARPPLVFTDDGTAAGLTLPAGTRTVSVAGAIAGAPGDLDDRGVPHEDSAAYVIYTSGSTGTPKGVTLSRRALARFAHAAPVGLRDGTRLLAVTTLSFDIAVLELIVPLVRGGCVVVAADDEARDPGALARIVRDEDVTVMQATPSLWGVVLEDGRADLSGVDVVVGGEALPDAVARGLAERARSVVNMYGPTEATVWCTSAEVTTERNDSSIGHAYPGTGIRVLDRWLRPVDVGVVGELYVTGEQLARGYRGRAGQTATRFVPDLFGDGRMYRTGDLVRRTASGDLDYLGRSDAQVKVRGYRVELGEIEALAARNGAVRGAIAAVRSDRICLYVTTRAPLDTTGLTAELASELPGYTVPSAITILDEFPLTPNLKVDRAALPDPEFTAMAGRAPEGAVEIDVARIVADVLDVAGVSEMSADADLFTLGATSLALTRILGRIAHVFDATITLRQAFDAPTVAGLAALVAAAPRAQARIEPRGDGATPLSFAQERLWLQDRLASGDPARASYNIPLVLDLQPGTADTERWTAALAAVAHRHEVLRTTITVGADGPIVRIGDTAPELEVLDLTGEGCTDEEFAAAIDERARTPFDLAASAPWRVSLLRGTERAVLLVVVHHIAADEWSVEPLLRDLTDAYEGRDLAPLAVQYGDVAAWERARPQRTADLDFWREALTGAPDEITLPTDRPRPPAPSGRGGDVWLDLDARTVTGLRQLASRSGATTTAVAQAAVAALLARVGAGDDIVLGVPIAQRPDAALEDVVGVFVDVRPVRLAVSDDATPEGLVRSAADATLAAADHPHARLEDVADALGVRRSAARALLFQVMVQHRRALTAPVAGPVRDVDFRSTGTAKFDLTVEFVESAPPATDARVRLEYSADLFDRDGSEALAGRLDAVLREFAAAAPRVVGDIDVLAPDERPLPAAPPATGLGLADLLRESRIAGGDAVALVFGGTEITYRALDERVAAAAATLQARGVTRGDVVALHMDRGVDFVVALLAVLDVGAAYLPVDPTYPDARVRYVLDDARPALVIREAIGAPPSEGAPRRVPARGDDAAYVLYTSGSTGTPKGVVGTAGALANRLAWQRDLTAGPGPDVRLAKSSVSFVDGTTEILAGLVAGARVVIASDDESRDVAALARLVRDHGVGMLTAVPSLAASLAGEYAADVAAIHTWFLSGEPLGADLVARLRGAGARVFDSYGSSEVAGDVTVWEADGPRVLVGAPVAGTSADVRDARLRPVASGVVGELYVGGVQSARGYLARPGLTATRFVAAPGGERVFRTGDLVRRLRDGRLEFVARADRQLALRGLRIEPGEIEGVLTAHPSVGRALVDVRALPGGDGIVAYVTGTGADASALTAHAREFLPDYMVPTIVVLDEYPLLPGGKVDRAALPLPAAAPRRAATADEQLYCDLLAELVGPGGDGTEVGPDDDFFALGGSSLLAARLIAAVKERTGWEPTLRDVFELRTPAAMARAAAPSRTERAPLVACGLPPVSPVSTAQRRLWFQYATWGPSPTYTIAFGVRLNGDVDTDALTSAFAAVAARHEPLRTTFGVGDDDRPVQIVHPAGELGVPVEIVDSDLDPASGCPAAEDLLRTHARAVFRIDEEGPLRGVLVRGSGTAVLLVLVHHIAADEWSATPLMRDLAAAYSAAVGPAGATEPSPLPVQYRDFTQWHDEILAAPGGSGDSVRDEQLRFWTQRLQGAPDEIALPRDRRRPSEPTFAGAAAPFHLDAALRTRLEAVAAEQGASMFMLTHAAVAVLLAGLGAGRDVVVGAPVAGRGDAALHDLVGFFVNTVVLRTELVGDPSFADVLAQVRDEDLDAFAHQDVPFDAVVDALDPERSFARNPLFQVLVQYRDPIEPIALTGLDAAPLFVEPGTAKFDLTFDLGADDAGGVRGRLEYATDLFDDATATALAERLRALLTAIAADPHTPISRLDPVLDTERDALAAIETGPAAPEPAPGDGLGHRFAAQAAATPDAVALVEDATGTELTYRELDDVVERVARAIRATASITPESVVGVAAQRGIALVVGLLATHRAGAAYLPLDQSYPVDRLAYMVADAAPAVILADGPRDVDVPVIVLREDGSPDTDVASGDASVPSGGDHPAYVVYTSGSTGRPKGVSVPHRAVLNRIDWGQERFGLTSDDRVLQKTPCGFDVSVWEFFWPLLTGATLVLATPDGHRDPGYLREVLVRRAITTTHFVPSMLGAFLDDLENNDLENDDRANDDLARPSIRRVLCSGEALTASHRDRFHRLVDGELFNLYGPTEAGIEVTCARIGATDPVTIGWPIRATSTHVLDEWLRRVPPGVAGELYLGGVQLARGYVGKPGTTAERFVADPFAPGSGERLYRTGDIVRRREGGGIEYLGRADGQVKLRGLRVELGEIEGVLASHPAVDAAVAVVGGGQVHAYVVAREDVAYTDVIAHAATVLPEYMLPATVTMLDAFPLTPNGKLDRGALPEPHVPVGGRAAETDEERAVCALLARVLDVGDVAADDDFFVLGGDSISSMTLVNSAAREGIRFSARDVFQLRTAAGLAAVAEFERPEFEQPETPAGDDDGTPELQADPGGPAALTPAIHAAREAGDLGAAGSVRVEIPDGVTDSGIDAVLTALVQAHDALRLTLTRTAGVIWSLDVAPSHGASAELGSGPVDPEAGRMLSATRNGAELEVLIHEFAADDASLAVVAADLRAGLDAVARGDEPIVARPEPGVREAADALTAAAQDPALFTDIAHWSAVLAGGGGLATGERSSRTARVAVGPDLARGDDPARGDDARVRDIAADALADALAATGRDTNVPVAVLTRGAAVAGTVGSLEVVVPRSAATRGASVADTGYATLRHLNAQTAPALAGLPHPVALVRVLAPGVVPAPSRYPLELRVWADSDSPSVSIEMLGDTAGFGDGALDAVCVAWERAFAERLAAATAGTLA
ncbi:non-ribosomal peptide synthetase [Rhodococcus rhodnii]|uniref:Non-ribosomal peptide synthetase n=2 Tax=Rhodococcus rhodnii TaxID=38312 RepID=R7WJX3_9NOCA|nr:non-ribosomal peptide synthetase [Rhodococcus rhodnii]EOM75621.1 non-ribosomal peptide synthetase [Rhodococcus rhodnii LMG 5362]TXG91862.1 non-ribosomal peptide synthetase [Rhodococcus rhodnii]